MNTFSVCVFKLSLHIKEKRKIIIFARTDSSSVEEEEALIHECTECIREK